MFFHAVRFLVVSVLLAVSCSRHATAPNGVTPKPPASLIACNSTSECPSGEVCDFLVPGVSKPGTCLNSCKSDSECQSNQVCNPISGACETSCNNKPDCVARMKFNEAICTSGHFCAAPASSNCPSNKFAGSQGFCKLKCSSNADCSGNSGQICNPLTSTCELSCSVSSQNACEPLSGLNLTGAGTQNGPALVTYDCSPVTNTCAASCRTGSETCGGNQTCYLPGAPANTPNLPGGTCEFACGGAQTCLTSPFTQCSENVCKKGCNLDKDCNANQRCNLLSKICETPCSVSGDCASQYLACSPLTGVCVPSCVFGTSGCGSFGANLECYVPGIPQPNSQGTCEIKCTGNSCAGLTPYGQCVAGFCQKACAKDTDCASLFQRCNAFTKVCESACSTSLDCHSTSLACSPVTKTCVGKCNLPDTVCGQFFGTAYQCYTSGVAPSQSNPNPVGTCEVTCTTQQNTCTSYPPFTRCQGGVCLQQCLVDTECLSTERCNIFTNNCQQTCGPGKPCVAGFGCSPITGTCVTQCSPGQQNLCAGDQFCYVPGNPPRTPNTIGTCEQSCTQSFAGSCQTKAPYTQCAGNICQKVCASDADCAGSAPNTRCDAIFKVCETPCLTTTDCAALSQYFGCSPFTNTCVPTCNTAVTTAVCSDVDSVRRQCLASTAQSPNSLTCEIPCTTTADCTAVGPNLKCAQNINFCGIDCVGQPDSFCNTQAAGTTCRNGVCRR